jgi:hypothetical protein
VLATVSLAILGLAARFSITAAGLTPAMPIPDHDAADDHVVAEAQATTAHRALTGLVIGSAAATAIGTVLVAAGCIPESRPSAAAFAVVVALVMVLRTRTHIDARRRAALVVCGMVAIAAGCAIVVAAAPQRAPWICLLVAAAGVGNLRRPPAAQHVFARRAVDALEYAALVAVVPVACWVSGVYASVRGLSLS